MYMPMGRLVFIAIPTLQRPEKFCAGFRGQVADWLGSARNGSVIGGNASSATGQGATWNAAPPAFVEGLTSLREGEKMKHYAASRLSKADAASEIAASLARDMLVMSESGLPGICTRYMRCHSGSGMT